MDFSEKDSLFGEEIACRLSLYQLTRHVGDSIRRNSATQNVWVMAELSDVRSSGGHCYMELVEKNDSGSTLAKMRGAIWNHNFSSLRKKFLSATGREISTGLKVLVYGSVTHHDIYGICFAISDIDPSYTLGDIERHRKEILARLAKEGIIDNNKSLHLTDAPQKIAVISAAGAAGYGDFMQQLANNSDGIIFYPMLFQAVLQGEKTSLSVRQALRKIEMSVDFWDCVAILRGGGSTTDLVSFDDYELAKAVANFPLPVIVGIGHERDRTVLDEIAHTRMKTPTAAAAFFIDRARDSYADVCDKVSFISRYVADRISGENRNIANLESALSTILPAKIQAHSDRLNHLAGMLPTMMAGKIVEARLKLQNAISSLPAILSQRYERENSLLNQASAILTSSIDFKLRSSADRIAALESLVAALSPTETLKRGYSITRIHGRALKSTDNLHENAKITTTLYNGKIESIITEINNNGK